MNNEPLKYSLIFALLGAIFYISFIGGVHLFDWDEINFAEISREMILLSDFTRVHVNFEPFYQKPPFFFWCQVVAMKIFGVNEFAARLPNAICGVITLVLLYNIGRKLYNHRFGLIWATVYFGTILPFLYFKSGIIDPIFNLFIFLGLYYFILFYWKKDQFKGIKLTRSKWFYLFVGGMYIGMGILTKGQVAYLIAALTLGVYWIYKKARFYVNVPQFLFFTVAATLVTLTWYGLETLNNGPEFIYEFNKYQYRLFSTPDAGHKGFPGYHFAVLLIGCFPASIFLIRSFFKMPAEEHEYQADFKRWMKYLFWVVLILFTIVRSKIVHYSSMCYFPLTFLAANYLYHLSEQKVSFPKWIKTMLYSIGGLFIAAIIAAPFVGRNTDSIKDWFKDPFAQANLEAQVNWTGLEVIPGIVLLIVLILSIRWLSQNRFDLGLRTLFGGTAIFVMLTLIFFIGRIEKYSQNAAITFFKSKVNEKCYVITDGYKSYGHLFYTKKPPVTDERSFQKDWLLQGDVDRPVYVVTKIHKADNLRAFDTLEEIGSKNGFVFFKRK